jgi:hypothetical protein
MGERMPTHPRAIPSGWTVFAGSLLLLVGCFNVIWGLVALLNRRVITVSGQGLIVWDLRVWGWAYVITGLLMAATSYGLFTMQTWARWLAVGFVGLNAIVQVVYFTAYPLWSLLVILLDVAIIYQLSARWQPEP